MRLLVACSLAVLCLSETPPNSSERKSINLYKFDRRQAIIDRKVKRYRCVEEYMTVDTFGNPIPEGVEVLSSTEDYFVNLDDNEITLPLYIQTTADDILQKHEVLKSSTRKTEISAKTTPAPSPSLSNVENSETNALGSWENELLETLDEDDFKESTTPPSPTTPPPTSTVSTTVIWRKPRRPSSESASFESSKENLRRVKVKTSYSKNDKSSERRKKKVRKEKDQKSPVPSLISRTDAAMRAATGAAEPDSPTTRVIEAVTRKLPTSTTSTSLFTTTVTATEPTIRMTPTESIVYYTGPTRNAEIRRAPMHRYLAYDQELRVPKTHSHASSTPMHTWTYESSEIRRTPIRSQRRNKAHEYHSQHVIEDDDAPFEIGAPIRGRKRLPAAYDNIDEPYELQPRREYGYTGRRSGFRRRVDYEPEYYEDEYEEEYPTSNDRHRPGGYAKYRAPRGGYYTYQQSYFNRRRPPVGLAPPTPKLPLPLSSVPLMKAPIMSPSARQNLQPAASSMQHQQLPQDDVILPKRSLTSLPIKSIRGEQAPPTQLRSLAPPTRGRAPPARVQTLAPPPPPPIQEQIQLSNDSNGMEIASPENCHKIKALAGQFGIPDVPTWARDNCSFLQLYAPAATCDQIFHFIESCNKMAYFA